MAKASNYQKMANITKATGKTISSMDLEGCSTQTAVIIKEIFYKDGRMDLESISLLIHQDTLAIGKWISNKGKVLSSGPMDPISKVFIPMGKRMDLESSLTPINQLMKENSIRIKFMVRARINGQMAEAILEIGL